MTEQPRHLRLETYHLNKIQDIKDHVLGMLVLALPEGDRPRKDQDWEQLLYSPEGQFGVLFGSLKLIRDQVGEEAYGFLQLMAGQLKSTHDEADWQRFADTVHQLDTASWLPRPKLKAN